jgi:hypothetical protein
MMMMGREEGQRPHMQMPYLGYDDEDGYLHTRGAGEALMDHSHTSVHSLRRFNNNNINMGASGIGLPSSPRLMGPRPRTQARPIAEPPRMARRDQGPASSSPSSRRRRNRKRGGQALQGLGQEHFSPEVVSSRGPHA